MKRTGVIEKIQLTYSDLGQQYTTINGKTYHTWFDFANGIREGLLVEYEEELEAKVCDCPHPGNRNAAVYADVARNVRVIPKMG